MNIFVLDLIPEVAAAYHCDKHVVKMIVETAQLLSTAHRVLDGTPCIRISPKGRKLKYWQHKAPLYKPTHVNHPCAVWVREEYTNYVWTYKLFVALCKEYTLRYGKEHATFTKLNAHLYNAPHSIPKTLLQTLTPFRLAIKPEILNTCQDSSVVKTYRNYYMHKYNNGLKMVWRSPSQIPEWFKV